MRNSCFRSLFFLIRIRFVFIVSKAVIFWIQSFSYPSTRDPSWLGTFANHPTKRKWPVTLAQMRRMYGLFYLHERWKMAAWTKGNVGTSGIGSSRIIPLWKWSFPITPPEGILFGRLPTIQVGSGYKFVMTPTQTPCTINKRNPQNHHTYASSLIPTKNGSV